MNIDNDIVIILNGTSSSGKSSIAKEIQAQIEGSIIHAQVDMFISMFDSAKFKTGQEAFESVEVSFSLFQNAIENMCKTNYPIIIDTVFERFEYYQGTTNAVSGKNTYLIGVHCPREELELRERKRGDRRTGLAGEQLSSVHENKSYDFEVDTSKLSPSECAALIIEFVNHRSTDDY